MQGEVLSKLTRMADPNENRSFPKVPGLSKILSGHVINYSKILGTEFDAT